MQVALCLVLASVPAADAQGVSTAGIRGTVNAPLRSRLDARVLVRHDGTGYETEVRLTNGRFLIQGLEPGGPYTVTVRALGYAPQRVERVVLSLGEMREIVFALETIATRLDDVAIVAQDAAGIRGRADGGTGTTISQSSMERLPTLNRDLYDFVRFVPQVSTRIGLTNPGMAAGGAGFRSNNFLINGVSERTLSGGVSNAFGGVRSIPLDAVQEYQVLISPYDVRYGDFTGALVNTVTRSGTNSFHGSAFAYGRTDWLGRDTSVSSSGYERMQYGLSLGGPLVRDRLHFFVASEVQHYAYPAPGPYVGQPADAERPVPIGAADVARFDALMQSYGLTAGSAGAVENESPLRNLFARLDLTVPSWKSRAVIWHNYSGSNEAAFSRAASLDDFPLSSYRSTNDAEVRAGAFQFHTTLGRSGTGHNELLISRRSEALHSRGTVEQPIVRVSVPSISGGRVTITSGTNEVAQGVGVRSSAFALKDNLTLVVAARHILTLGAEAEWFRVRRGNGRGSYGTWSFPSLDAFAAGSADLYAVRIDFGNDDTELGGAQYSVYAGDQWQVTDRLSLTGGVRADLLALGDQAPYHQAVESIFGRRTDQTPRARVEMSPRLGFVWELDDARRQRLRGGAGVFAGRYPLAWAHASLSSYGVGGTLSCNFNGPATAYPPMFDPNPRTTPTSCLGGQSLTTAFRGDVDLLDPDLRMLRVARGSLAYERRLPRTLLLTSEALVTRTLSDVVFVNMNLQGPEATDAYGRVLYGPIRSTGLNSPTVRSGFFEVIDVRNTNRGYAYQLSARLETTHERGLGGSASYTFSRARDVQTPLRVNARGTAAWGVARTMSGRHEELEVGVSGNDIPHRVVLAGTYVAPWTRARTELSFYYVGESGRPFAYTAFSTGRRGDLNADGAINDPIYVPRNALDASEMQFSGVSDAAGADTSASAVAARELAQRQAFERFVDSESCLRRQRGHIMARNSCHEPWSNTTIASVRQAIPFGARAVDVQLDVFNVLNLMHDGWGLRRDALPALLEHVGQTAEPAPSRPVFRFDAARPAWNTQSTDSAFQLQLALRYRF